MISARPAPKQCPMCTGTFQPKGYNHKYCSPACLRSARDKQRPTWSFRPDWRKSVHFSPDVLAQLDAHAARRGMRAPEMARRIITTVVDEGMVDAVLDDGCARARAKR